MNDFEDLSGFEWETFGFCFDQKDDSVPLPAHARGEQAPPVGPRGSQSYLDTEDAPRKTHVNNKRKYEDVNDSQSSLEAQLKQLRNELKKTEKLRERLIQVEEQNSIMKAELKHFNTSPQDIKRKNDERIMSMLKLISGFNAGDIENLRRVIGEVSSQKCSILTPSLFQELRGRNAVIQFFSIMLETFPDGFFELSETELEESGVVISKFAFTGTKISPLPSDMLYEKWKNLSLEEIYKKRQNQKKIVESGSLQETFLNIRSAVEAGGGKAAAAAAAQVLPAGELRESLLECALHPPPAPALRPVPSAESAASTDDKGKGGSEASTSGVAAKTPGIKISGHIIATYDSSNELINRLIFVWNTTSLLGQIFGFSDGDLEVLNGVMSIAQPKNPMGEGRGAGAAV